MDPQATIHTQWLPLRQCSARQSGQQSAQRSTASKCPSQRKAPRPQCGPSTDNTDTLRTAQNASQHIENERLTPPNDEPLSVSAFADTDTDIHTDTATAVASRVPSVSCSTPSRKATKPLAATAAEPLASSGKAAKPRPQCGPDTDTDTRTVSTANTGSTACSAWIERNWKRERPETAAQSSTASESDSQRIASWRKPGEQSRKPEDQQPRASETMEQPPKNADATPNPAPPSGAHPVAQQPTPSPQVTHPVAKRPCPSCASSEAPSRTATKHLAPSREAAKPRPQSGLRTDNTDTRRTRANERQLTETAIVMPTGNRPMSVTGFANTDTDTYTDTPTAAPIASTSAHDSPVPSVSCPTPSRAVTKPLAATAAEPLASSGKAAKPRPQCGPRADTDIHTDKSIHATLERGEHQLESVSTANAGSDRITCGARIDRSRKRERPETAANNLSASETLQRNHEQPPGFADATSHPAPIGAHPVAKQPTPRRHCSASTDNTDTLRTPASKRQRTEKQRVSRSSNSPESVHGSDDTDIDTATDTLSMPGEHWRNGRRTKASRDLAWAPGRAFDYDSGEMPTLDSLPEYCPADLAAWRGWLRKHHRTSAGVWLVYYKVASPKHNVRYGDAVDEALCWGWIDSKMQPLDEERYRQVFSPRKPRSVWSALNKRKIAVMEAAGRLQPAGRLKMEAAIANGSWTALDAVEALQVPADLEQALEADSQVRTFYESLTQGRKKMILTFLNNAKREETRKTRIAAICRALHEGRSPALAEGWVALRPGLRSFAAIYPRAEARGSDGRCTEGRFAAAVGSPDGWAA
jgi:uncharacterized protein YdeI (YjbR/CyaY-like superfamily)